jgi:hypothetical protein
MRKWTVIMMLAAAGGVGCAGGEEKAPSNMRARQDEALRDPFNYSPTDRTDVSGGGITDFKSDAFIKDVNSVFSP